MMLKRRNLKQNGGQKCSSFNINNVATFKTRMNKLYVQTLNECLGIDGPDWIEDNPDNYVETHKSAAPICARMKRTKEWKENIGKANTGKTHMKGKCSKVWKITYENGNTEIVYEGLPLWCEKKGYSWSKIRDLSRGKAKKSSGLVSVVEVSQGRWQKAQETL